MEKGEEEKKRVNLFFFLSTHASKKAVLTMCALAEIVSGEKQTLEN